MLAWARRHTPEALLIPAGIGAGAVTVLSDVDEVVPWGHELGIGVSQLAFAYVGAYIFNWLIVERPKAKALRGYYWAAANTLQQLQVLPFRMLNVLTELMQSNRWFAGRVATFEEIEEALGRIQWFDVEEEKYRGMQDFEMYSRQHREAYETIAPLLSELEPDISVAIARMNSAPIHTYIAEMRELPPMLFDTSMHGLLTAALMDYQQKGVELGEALAQSKYTPFRRPPQE